MNTFANIEDLDEIPHSVTLHPCLHFKDKINLQGKKYDI